MDRVSKTVFGTSPQNVLGRGPEGRSVSPGDGKKACPSVPREPLHRLALKIGSNSGFFNSKIRTS